MAKSAQDIIGGALDRARGRSAAVHFIGRTDGGYAVYAVDSSRDVDSAYTVTVSPAGELRCDCPSEQRIACWHRAAVFALRANRKAWGLPADGHNPEEERALARSRARRALEVLLGGRGVEEAGRTLAGGGPTIAA